MRPIWAVGIVCVMVVVVVEVLPCLGDGHSTGEAGPGIVLWWTPFTGISGQYRECEVGTCYFTEDRSYLHNTRTKAVVFYGSDVEVEDMPVPRPKGQWWALLHEESPKNQPLMDHLPALALFNLTATFRRASHFPLTLQHLDSLHTLVSATEFLPTARKNTLMADEGLAPVVYVQSDCDTPSERDQYVQQLAKYIPIDSYGACLHNRDLPAYLHDPADTYDHKDFRSIMAKYKFTLAIENAACEDYITEKLWRPLTLGSVPIYWGSPSVKDWEPNPDSVIKISDFESPKQLASFLQTLMDDDERYDSYLQHKLKHKLTNTRLVDAMNERKWGINNDFEKGNFIEHFECFICDQILTRHSAGTRRPDSGEIMASLDHYGCPPPPTVLHNAPNPKSYWLEQWHKGRVEAKVLLRLILAGETFTADEFYDQVIDELHEDGFFKRFPPEHVEL